MRQVVLKGNYPYDVSKSASDLIVQSYVKTYNLKAGIIRSGNIYGPGDLNMDRLVPHVIISSILKKRSVLRSNGKLIRDYIYVDDVARITMEVGISQKGDQEIFNICSSQSISILELAKKICAEFDKLNNTSNSKKYIIYTPVLENEQHERGQEPI